MAKIAIEATRSSFAAFWLGVAMIKLGCLLTGISFRMEQSGGAGGDA